ncbi:MAG: aminopeptidase P family protein [Victivallales bacterium]|nr:aminopeptidase P family protein [Victivallales bacterium]
MNCGKLICAASEVNADILYKSGFFAPDPFLYLETNEGALMVVNDMEVTRAREQRRPSVQVLTYDEAAKAWDLGTATSNNANLVAALSEKLGIECWQVPRDFPLGLAYDIQNAYNIRLGIVGEHLQFRAVKRFAPERDVKTAAEIQALRGGVRLAEAGLAAGLAVLREASIEADGGVLWHGQPVTSELLHGVVNAEIARLGGNASHTIIAPGVQGACPHNEGSGAVHAGEPIVFDIFPRDEATGYYGDLTRTVVKGTATAQVRQAFEAVRDVQRKIVAMLRPGVTGKQAQEETERLFKELGYQTDSKAKVPYGFIHGVGHGLGLEIHESPGLNLRNDKPLVPGNVVTVEPGLYYPEWGGVRIEDDVVITEDGCEDLMTVPVQLEIP